MSEKYQEDPWICQIIRSLVFLTFKCISNIRPETHTDFFHWFQWEKRPLNKSRGEGKKDRCLFSHLSPKGVQHCQILPYWSFPRMKLGFLSTCIKLVHCFPHNYIFSFLIQEDNQIDRQRKLFLGRIDVGIRLISPSNSHCLFNPSCIYSNI